MQKWWRWFIGLGVMVSIGSGVWWYYQHRTILTGQLHAETFALVSSAENSSLDYQKQYRYVEDIHDGRGYTAGIIGFTSATGDLLKVVNRYQQLAPRNRLKKYLPALRKVNGSASHRGLGSTFVRDWHQAAKDQRLVRAQNDVVEQMYLRPAVKAAQKDGLAPLGQYIYYDALVVHGPGNGAASFGGIRRAAKLRVKTPAQGGSVKNYLRTFLVVRAKVMRQETAHQDLSRLNTQWQFVVADNERLRLPLTWKMYGQTFTLTKSKLRQIMR